MVIHSIQEGHLWHPCLCTGVNRFVWIVVLHSTTRKLHTKGAPPIAADFGGFPDFGIFLFFEKLGFGEFSSGIWGLGVFAIDWKWLWASNGRILSPFRASESISIDFHDFGHFGVVSGGLTLVPEGPGTLRNWPVGPGTLSEGPR